MTVPSIESRAGKGDEIRSGRRDQRGNKGHSGKGRGRETPEAGTQQGPKMKGRVRREVFSNGGGSTQRGIREDGRTGLTMAVWNVLDSGNNRRLGSSKGELSL